MAEQERATGPGPSGGQPTGGALPRGRQPRRGCRVLISIVVTLLLSTCVFHEGQQIELDFMGPRYRFYIYEKPSYEMVVLLKLGCQRERGSGREQWGRCSLLWLRRNIDVPALSTVDWNHFTEGGQWRDYTDAITNVGAGRVSTDMSRQNFVDRCLIGSHAAFGAYDWGHRVTNDAHCKRGKYAR
ncbi:MAG: hypothetical protein JWM47_1412 [Acidimicrobiales bacterium]|nr:hypothetical protein [Acidimicrobiales bacterium]